MSDEFDAISIGSGLGGLTAAALYARLGHRVLVLERNDDVGGAATTFRHSGLIIEASLHETAQLSTPGDPKARILAALGLTDELDFVSAGPLYQLRGGLFAEPFVLPCGFDEAEAALVERFPRHRSGFRRYFRRLSALQDATAAMGEQHDSLWWFLHAPTLPLSLWPLIRDLRRSVSEIFTDLFGDDELPKVAVAANLGYYGDDPDTLWWLYYAVAQAGYLSGGGSYIKGGSSTLSRSLAGVVLEEGGEVRTRRTVTEILLDGHGAAVGVAHTAPDGGDRVVERAPVLFGNAALSVLAAALPAERRSAFNAQFAGRGPSTSLCSIAVGLDRPAAEVGVTHYSTMLLPDWFTKLTDHGLYGDLMAGMPGARLPGTAIVNYGAIDSGLDSDGAHLVSITTIDRLANWQGLDPQAYGHKRDAWMDALIGQVDQTFPGFAAAVVQREMATAATMHRYLNTPGGAVYGFAQTPPHGIPTAGTSRGVHTVVPGLWLASTFGGLGGFTGAMMSGMLAAKAAMASMARADA